MNVENRMKILKSLLLSAEKGYQLGAPYHHYVEMFNQNINDAIFYLAAIKFSEVNVESLEPTKYKLDICDNHGVHCIEVDKIEIDDLIYALDVFGVLCDLPSSEVVRLKKEITDSKDPKYLELLPNFEYFDDTGSL